MKAVIFVVHGSQIRQKNLELSYLLNQTIKELGDFASFYKIAYLERQADTIEVVTNEAIEFGADELLIVPVLLSPALHAIVDIPGEVQAVSKNFPKVSVKFLKTIGDEEPIIDILINRVNSSKIINPKAEIILLAHGTRHFGETEEYLDKIAQELSVKTQSEIKAVDYLGKQTFRSVIKENVAQLKPQVIIPFFLYDGALVEKIYREVQKLSLESEIPFTQTLSLDSRIILALVSIVQGEKQFDTDFIKLTK